MKFLKLDRCIIGIVFTIFSFCLQPIFTHANHHIASRHLTMQNERVFAKESILTPKPVKDENWFLGATPEKIDYNKLPIVFVHGLHGHASEWWGGNVMYERAYKEGFRTAFVSLSGESNNWDNGKQLANILEKISNHFNGKVNIVAHSKGGIDTQTALIHFGAHSYVNNVITLSTPFHGTALADLAYSAPAKWLMKLLGKLDPGTESLQTANMDHFRKITDFNQNISKNRYYTAAGTDWGPAFSASWFGGVYLSKVGGANDGQVNVSSTQLPYGKQLFVAPLTHENIHQGSAVFEKINPILQKTTNNLQPFSMVSLKGKEIRENNSTFESTEQFINGGILPPHKTIEEKISIDSSIHSTDLYILTKNEDNHIELVSPSKKKYNTKHIKTKFIPRNEMFGGSYLQSITIDQPEEGDWKLYMSSVNEDAYFMLAQFNSNPIVSINMDSKVKTNTSIPLQIKVENPDILDMDYMKINIKKGERKISKEINEKIKDDILVKMIPISNETGNLNITIEIEGKTKLNSTFKRTEVRSIHVSE